MFWLMVLLSMIYVKKIMGQGKMYKCDLNTKPLEIPTMEDVIGNFLDFAYSLVNYLDTSCRSLYNLFTKNKSISTDNIVSDSTKS